MTDPSLTISIDRTALSLSALEFVGSGVGSLGITDYREPALQPRVVYAPSSDFQHGDLAMGWTWQQTLLNFSFYTVAASEADSRTLVTAVRTAITQALEYEVTVTVGGAPAETWLCNPGTLTPASSRAYLDLRDADPVWDVSLPCYPVRSIA